MATGGSIRANLMIAADKGNVTAIASLYKGPRLPPAVSYLWQWYVSIRNGLAEREDGSLRKLDWVQLDAWARRKRIQLHSHELDALFLIDGVFRKPEALETIVNER